jgi:hypothetical protein
MLIKKYGVVFIKNNVFLFSLIFITMVSFTFFLNHQVFSDFPRKEIMDDISDVKKINLKTGEKLKNGKLNNNSSSALDIQRVSLFQKSNRLNATVWLGGNPAKISNISNISTIAFGVLVDSDKDSSTGKEGVDYQLEIQQIKNNISHYNQNWNKVLLEYSSLGQFRILDVEKNYTKFIDDGKNIDYVLFSIDMNKILVNISYRIMFYSLVSYNDGKIAIDLTNWINIPTDSFSLFTTPEDITLRQGESKTIGLQIISDSGKMSTITDLFDLKNYTALNIDLLGQNTSNTNSKIGMQGTEPIQLKLTVPKDAKVGKHTIPISANVSFGSYFPSNFIEFQNKYPIFIDTRGYELKNGNFTVNVIEPLSFQEQLKDFWGVYGSIISLMSAGFAGGISTLFFEYLKERRKKPPPINGNWY